MGGIGVVHHEEVGAAWLAGLGFSADVTELVRGHVEAKRYLVAARSGYAERLSEASVHTLAHQGGPMSPEEQRAFDRDPLREAKLRLRAWDEEAKVPGRETPGLDHYRALLEAHLAERTQELTPDGS